MTWFALIIKYQVESHIEKEEKMDFYAATSCFILLYYCISFIFSIFFYHYCHLCLLNVNGKKDDVSKSESAPDFKSGFVGLLSVSSPRGAYRSASAAVKSRRA